jgi:hypothetical protein
MGERRRGPFTRNTCSTWGSEINRKRENETELEREGARKGIR